MISLGDVMKKIITNDYNLKEEDMTEVAKIIAGAIYASDNEQALKNLRERSLKLCQKHPLYS